MAYDYIKPGQKLQFDCLGCGKELEIDVDTAKTQEKMTIVCEKCGKENKLNTKKIMEDLDKRLREMAKAQHLKI